MNWRNVDKGVRSATVLQQAWRYAWRCVERYSKLDIFNAKPAKYYYDFSDVCIQMRRMHTKGEVPMLRVCCVWASRFQTCCNTPPESITPPRMRYSTMHKKYFGAGRGSGRVERFRAHGSWPSTGSRCASLYCGPPTTTTSGESFTPN